MPKIPYSYHTYRTTQATEKSREMEEFRLRMQIFLRFAFVAAVIGFLEGLYTMVMEHNLQGILYLIPLPIVLLGLWYYSSHYDAVIEKECSIIDETVLSGKPYTMPEAEFKRKERIIWVCVAAFLVLFIVIIKVLL